MQSSAEDKVWDVFVSHASEDKESVALPLARRLRRAGLTVWLDVLELKVGDSLLGRIDEGLAASRFGIVVFSPAFMAKKWTGQELRGLFALETPGQQRILPVWHKVGAAEMISYSPILADRVAATTARGVDEVATAIISAILRDGPTAASISSRLVRRLAVAVEGQDVRAVAEFLGVHRSLLGAITGMGTPETVDVNPFSQISAVHLLAGNTMQTTRLKNWTLVALLNPSDSVLNQNLEPSLVVAKTLDEIRALRREIALGPISGCNKLYTINILVGRRNVVQDTAGEALQEFANQLIHVRLRTYDFLLDGALEHFDGTDQGRA